MKKQKITDDLFSDKRLQPLNKPDSKLLLQLFIGKITHDGVQSHQLLYGWCLVTPRPDVSDHAVSGSFIQVYSDKKTKVAIARISIYQHGAPIVRLVNELLAGKSFKASATVSGIDVSNIKFDFTYNSAIEGNIRIRPILFNETAPNISRNMFEKYMFHSPYGSSPSFTLPIVNLDKLRPLRSIDGLLPEYKTILLKILEHLESETKMSFASIECARFGNIEFINGPCANIYERAQAYFENISEEELIDGIKEKTSKKIRVTIMPNEYTFGHHLLVNCFSTNGGQVILDEIKEIHHSEKETITVDFETEEPVSNLVVSVWVKENESWQIWYKDSAVLLRQISLRMGAVGTTGKVSSPFLERVLAAGSHMKDPVSKAMEINRTSYMTSTIGGKGLDPWVDADYNFSTLVNSIVPKKSEAAFFPKGWNSNSGQHGALSFLQWFTDISDKATNVIIQDPYFDTVGMEFIARTSNSATSFDIITCTQTPSNDDDPVRKISLWKRCLNYFKSHEPIEKEPNRASRLLNMIIGFPELFAGSKITINDYRNKSSNTKSLLHDRYIIVYEHGKEPHGFHLSNSIQNATQNYPLLITPIPLDVVPQVEKYSVSLLDEGDRTGSYEMVKLYDYRNRKSEHNRDNSGSRKLPPDEKLFAELKSLVGDKDEADFEAIRQIFESSISDDYLKFEKFWDTFGWFLASVPSGDGMLSDVKNWFPASHAGLLKTYLTNLANEKNLCKFSSCRNLNRSGSYILFLDDFDEALRASFHAENGFFENYGFGNYQASYASWILMKINPEDFEELVKSVQLEIAERRKTENVNNMPVLRIASILFSDLTKDLFFKGSDEVFTICLLSDLMPLRTLAIAAIATDTVGEQNDMTFERASMLFDNLSFDERVNAFVALLHQTRFERVQPQEHLQKDIFKKLLGLLEGLDQEVIFKIIDRIISDKYFEQIEAHVTNNLLVPLIDTTSITVQDMLSFWRLKFEEELVECEATSRNNGVLDLAGWCIYAADEVDSLTFVDSMIRTSKRLYNTIRKPFMGGTTLWDNDYNRLLMIQSVSMIALNYLNSKDEVSIALGSKLNNLISEIKALKQNYPYYRDFNRVHLHNKQIAEKL